VRYLPRALGEYFEWLSVADTCGNCDGIKKFEERLARNRDAFVPRLRKRACDTAVWRSPFTVCRSPFVVFAGHNSRFRSLSRQRLVSEVRKPLKQAVLIVRQMLRETEGYQLFRRVDPTKRRCHACPTKRTNGTKSAGQTVIKSNCHSQAKPVPHPFIMKRNSKPGKMVRNHQVAGFARNDAHPSKLAAVAKHLTKASEVIECGEVASAATRVLSLPLNNFSLKWWHRFQSAVVDMLIHLREAILSSALNRECRVHHSQWFQNAGVQNFVEPLATHDFEDASENVRREAVFELRPRVVLQWESRQLGHKVFQGIAISRLAIDLVD